MVFQGVQLDRFLQWDPRLCVLLWHSFWVWFHVHVLDWTQATQLCWRGQALLCCGGQRWMRDGQPCKVSQGHLEDPLMGPTFTDSMHFRRVTPCLKASNSYFAGVQLQCTEFLWWYTCICIGNERESYMRKKNITISKAMQDPTSSQYPKWNAIRVCYEKGNCQ